MGYSAKSCGLLVVDFQSCAYSWSDSLADIRRYEYKMAFLRFEEGEAKTMQVVKVSDEFKRHWVGQQYMECSGEGCPLCKGNVRADTARNIEVLVGDQALTWTCPGAAFAALVAFAGSVEALVGRTITVKRVREQNKTRYKVVDMRAEAKAEATPEPVYWPGDVSTFLSTLDTAIKDSRFAEILEDLLVSRHGLPF